MFNSLRLLLLATLLQCFNQLSAQTITNFCGGDGAYSGDNNSYHTADFREPVCVVYNHDRMYISDRDNHRIRMINFSTGYINTIAGNGVAGFNGDGVAATSVHISTPIGLFVDSLGNVYFADSSDNRIRRVDGSTGIITTIAGNGTSGYSGDGGTATSASLHAPTSVFVTDTAILIADRDNNVIRKINAAGVITTFAGTGIAGYGDYDIPISVRLNHPTYVVCDNFGDVFFTDTYNNVIREVNAMSGMCYTIAGDGTAGNSGDGGDGYDALLNAPTGLMFKDWYLYIAQPATGTIRKLGTITGAISTIAGCGYLGDWGDYGLATDAKLDSPQYAFVVSDSDIYIADAYNNRIRRVHIPETGVSPIPDVSTIELFPNPNTGKFSIGSSAPAEITVTNAIGTTVTIGHLVNGHLDIDITGQSAGVYFVNIKANGLSTTRKVVLVK